jgi:hypothetical protein
MPRLLSELAVCALLVAVGCSKSPSKSSGAASGSLQPVPAGTTPVLPGTPPSGDECSRPIPDPGNDPCLTCALAHCCNQYVGSCLNVAGVPSQSCFYSWLGACLQPCFQNESTAHPGRSALLTISLCARTCSDPSYAEHPLWVADGPGPWFTKCLIGWTPRLLSDEDAGAGSFGGTATGQPCASVCVPGWH